MIRQRDGALFYKYIITNKGPEAKEFGEMLSYRVLALKLLQSEMFFGYIKNKEWY